MAGLMYYLPGRDTPPVAADFRELGLGHALINNAYGSRQLLGGGPDGGAGLLIAPTSEKLAYHKEEQTWTKHFARDWWVGFYNSDRPAPTDLARATQLSGHFVTLADGQDWLIPVARAVMPNEDRLDYACALPKQTGLDENGNWRSGDIMPQYAELWTMAQRCWDTVTAAILQEDPATNSARLVLDFPGQLDAAVLSLSMNYRVTKVEVAALSLLDEQSAGRVLGALVDFPTVMSWMSKKKLPSPPDALSTSAGQEG